METKFYEFSQNNSGGFFDVDDDVCHRIVIEAKSASEAEYKMEILTENQSGSCPCCGDRWYLSADEIEIEKYKEDGYSVGVYGFYDNPEQRWFDLYGEFPRLEEPSWGETISGSREFRGKIFFNSVEDYCQFMANAYGWTTPDVYIYYLDGTKHSIYKRGEKEAVQ